MKPKGQINILVSYFRDPVLDTSLWDFGAQLKQLTDKEKLELAQLCAKDMGLTQDEVDFPLQVAA